MPIYHLPSELSLTKKIYPGWGVLFEKLSDSYLKASDLRQILDLSYRQINDWDDRGMLKTYREKTGGKQGEGWRRFSIMDLIPIAILVELKKQGIPISKLKGVVDYLFCNDIMHYDFIPNIFLGGPTYFKTDLDKMIAYDCNDPQSTKTDICVDNMEDIKILLILPLNKIIARIFFKLKLPDFSARIDSDGKYHFTINSVPLALEKLDKVRSE